MPLLDVSDILYDPDFADTLTLTRGVQTVGSNGRTTMAETTSTIIGVVTSNSGDILKRFPDLARVEGSVMVTTPTVLQIADGSTIADRLAWRGSDYTVTAVNDYSSYGAGFVIALCERIAVT